MRSQIVRTFRAARGKGLRIPAIMLIALLLGLVASGGSLYSLSSPGESGKTTLSGKAPETQPKLDVPYEPTAYEIAEEMLRMADVRRDDVVYDLGCGDGRIVIMAAKERGARGVGVDMDPVRIRESIENATKAGVTDRVRFFVKDLFKTDIREATVVMLYLWPEVNLRLRPKLFTDLKPGTRIVSHSHTMGDWKPEAVSEISNHNLYSWIIPANVTGTWAWSLRAGKKDALATLRLTQRFQEIAGNLTIGNVTVPITTATLRGNYLHLVAEPDIEGRKVKITLSGYAKGDALHGQMILSRETAEENISWKAKRNPSSKASLSN
jgi:SAM-dependent methyltransferase